MFRSLFAIGVLCVLITMSTGATPPIVQREQSTIPGAAKAQGAELAGAGWTDITPLPGFATGGHGPAGAIARGYWYRLRTVAFYFEDPSGRGAALVSCDLFAVPTGLHQAIASHFTASNPANVTRVVLPPERIVVAATHTHHGPGNYLSAEVYNKQASKRSGFNRPLREFLQTQIIRAIEKAIVDARDHQGTAVEVLTGTLDDTLFRNRSPMTFMQDSQRQAILAALGSGIAADAAACLAARRHDEPGNDWDVAGCPRLRAVDRNVTFLRLRRGERTRGLAIFLSVHPTVLRAKTPLFSADVFGAARSRLEATFGHPVPVIGFFNGSEGDVATRRTTRTATDLVGLAADLSSQMSRVLAHADHTAVDLSAGIRGRLHYAHAGDVEPAGSSSWRLASEPMAGVATLGGAEGDRTALHLFAKPTARKPKGEHGVKVPALGWFRRLIAPSGTFPSALPLSVLHLGTLQLVATPNENSTAAVWRIREALGERHHGKLEVISMANEYASYLATKDEYQVQDYMGASTLWGPQQADFIATALGRLARSGEGISGVPGIDAPGKEKSFQRGNVGRRRRRPYHGYEAFLRDGLVGAVHLPAFEWCEAAPSSVAAGERIVEVVALDGSLRDADDIAVILREQPSADRAAWSAVWLTPLWERRAGVYRFRVVDGNRTIESESFAVGSSPPSACIDSRSTLPMEMEAR